MDLIGCTYNFCYAHQELSKAKHWGRTCTKAQASGLTDHVWRVDELFQYKVAPPPWIELKQRRRPKKAAESATLPIKQQDPQPRSRPLVRRRLGGFMLNHRLVWLYPEGTPPHEYIFRFLQKGIIGIDENEPIIGNEHLLKVAFGDEYPRHPPQITFLSPIFHPNIQKSGPVCIGWFRLPYILPDLCIHIAQMIDYQKFDTFSACCYDAADWADKHKDMFPLQNWSLPSDFSYKRLFLPNKENIQIRKRNS